LAINVSPADVAKKTQLSVAIHVRVANKDLEWVTFVAVSIH
jgi:hypothetical protein